MNLVGEVPKSQIVRLRMSSTLWSMGSQVSNNMTVVLHNNIPLIQLKYCWEGRKTTKISLSSSMTALSLTLLPHLFLLTFLCPYLLIFPQAPEFVFPVKSQFAWNYDFLQNQTLLSNLHKIATNSLFPYLPDIVLMTNLMGLLVYIHHETRLRNLLSYHWHAN